MKNSIAEVSQEVSRLRAQIQDTILSLPDNEDINRLSDNCYTIQLSKLDRGNLSPAHYDFKRTYRLIVEWMDNKQLENVLPSLDEAIRKGFFKYKMHKVSLHPKVKEYLQSIL